VLHRLRQTCENTRGFESLLHARRLDPATTKLREATGSSSVKPVPRSVKLALAGLFKHPLKLIRGSSSLPPEIWIT
jgi:hypothetical protein